MNENVLDINEDKLIAVQCLWNSDWDYIGLSIELVFTNYHRYRTQKIVELAYHNFGTQASLAIEAERIAKEYADKYDIIVYFPSPDNWSRDCPNWWDSHNAPKCEDCNIPIIPSDSKYLPKEVCYPCHLERESNAKIKNAEIISNRSVIIKDFNYRDDSILRFVYYVNKNKADKNSLLERYKNILTEYELSETISKLEGNNCLKFENAQYSVTEFGIKTL